MAAPAKLTETLRITGTRPDGYHEIDAEMLSLDLADELTFDHGDGLEVLGATGMPLAADDDNLVRRALAAVRRTAKVRLRKRIPVGAGLGGGSADAAAVLRWAGCTDLALAASLGADVPFCLVGGRARVRGIGEVVAPLAAVDRTYTLLVPPFGVSTAEVYRSWDSLGRPEGEHGNDLEPAALAVSPALHAYRERLAQASGLIPRLAGSGTTWFVVGAFPGGDRIVVRTAPTTTSSWPGVGSGSA
ncbi:4-(cytidine 5'-diphospho)-2-C-methyl-D-erythritol kinase [soil metagenome]